MFYHFAIQRFFIDIKAHSGFNFLEFPDIGNKSHFYNMNFSFEDKVYKRLSQFVYEDREQPYTQITLDDINSSKEDINYIISYSMKIFPSGHFRFEHSNTKLYGATATIALDLGKKYQCSGECIENFHFVEPDYPNTEKEIRLEFQQNDNNFHGFILKGIMDIRTEQGLSIGFLVSSIFLLISLIINLFEENEIEKKLKNILK